ncbi:MAG: acylphosphatase [Dehalococcoidia bacterium]|nr:acylphosphatase [Dehalococcoidia bacterium]
MEDVSFQAVVRGRVQGVGFRDFVARRARALGLRGYVRNLPDGHSVETVAEGRRETLEELLRHLKAGPPEARVERVDTWWSEASGDYERFRAIFREPWDGPRHSAANTVAERDG